MIGDSGSKEVPMLDLNLPVDEDDVHAATIDVNMLPED
jgi:hypothetical protein